MSVTLQKMVVLQSLLGSYAVEAWIGAKDVNGDDNVRFPEDGRVVGYTFWGRSEPLHSTGDCVKITQAGDQAMADCDTTLPFVCEILQ